MTLCLSHSTQLTQYIVNCTDFRGFPLRETYQENVLNNF